MDKYLFENMIMYGKNFMFEKKCLMYYIYNSRLYYLTNGRYCYKRINVFQSKIDDQVDCDYLKKYSD